jgi:hypothetical protein
VRACLVIVALLGCRSSAPAPAPDAGPPRPPVVLRQLGDPVAPGSLVAPRVEESYIVRVDHAPDRDRLRERVAAAAAREGLHVVDWPITTEDDGVLVAVGTGPAGFERPGPNYADIARAYGQNQLVIVSVAGPTTERWHLLALAYRLACAGAASCDVIDPWMAPAYWHHAQPDLRGRGGSIDVDDWVVFESDDHDEWFTVGMHRFGLPELVIADAHHERGYLRRLLIATAQRLIDGDAIAGPGVLDVGGFRWAATWGADRYGGPTIRLDVTSTDRAAGFRDAVMALIELDPQDGRLQEATARARAELAGLARRFARGIPRGERLEIAIVKNLGNHEYGWVEVASWDGKGSLEVRDPGPAETRFVGIDDVFDFMHTRADGTKIGGETVAIRERWRRGEAP